MLLLIARYVVAAYEFDHLYNFLAIENGYINKIQIHVLLGAEQFA